MLLLFAAPSFLVGGLLGRLRSLRGSWLGALLAVIAGALFPVGILLVLYSIQPATLPRQRVPFWLFLVGYPLGIGLAVSFPRLERPADLFRLRRNGDTIRSEEGRSGVLPAPRSGARRDCVARSAVRHETDPHNEQSEADQVDPQE